MELGYCTCPLRPKPTSVIVPNMFAFRDEALPIVVHMSAYDPKRKSALCSETEQKERALARRGLNVLGDRSKRG